MTHMMMWMRIKEPNLDNEPSYNKRLISEMVHIKMQKQGLNRQVETELLPEPYHQIIKSLSPF